jgi:catechol 2,3-dioxygenase-like lactoylglutathione lyase family enzyme
MKMRWISMWALLLLTLSALPAMAADGYATLGVPDMQQALNFFRDAMSCNVLSSTATPTARALLDCGDGGILELHSIDSRTSPAARTTPIAFVADDVNATARWLRHQHIELIGRPAPISAGPDRGKLALDLRTPWGQPLQLIEQRVPSAVRQPSVHLAAD